MKKIYNIVWAMLLFSCNESTIYDKQTYSTFPETIKLQGKDIILTDSVYFSYPQILVEDTLCCIYDMAVKEGRCCHIFKFPEFAKFLSKDEFSMKVSPPLLNIAPAK